MATFTCTTCGSMNTAPDGLQFAVCTRCGQWFYFPQTLQSQPSFYPSAGYSYQQPQQPAPQPEEYFPKVPAGNRYAGHDKLICKMAKDFVNKLFRYIEAKPWHPVTSDTKVADYGFEIWVASNKFFGCMDRFTVEINFVDYGMRSIPDVDAFKYALDPILMYYLKEKAKEVFGNVHRLSSYAVKGGVAPCLTNNRILFMEYRITQTLHPDNLRSW